MECSFKNRTAQNKHKKENVEKRRKLKVVVVLSVKQYDSLEYNAFVDKKNSFASERNLLCKICELLVK